MVHTLYKIPLLLFQGLWEGAEFNPPYLTESLFFNLTYSFICFFNPHPGVKIFLPFIFKERVKGGQGREEHRCVTVIGCLLHAP